MIKRWGIYVFLIMLIPLASSEIFVSSVSEIYNLGEEINFDVTLIPNTGNAEHLIGNVVCGGFSYNIFNQYYNLQIGEEIGIEVTTRLVNPDLISESNNCYLSFTFGNEVVASDTFLISGLIYVEFEWDFDTYDPGQTVLIRSTSEREGGGIVQGFGELTIETLGIHDTRGVSDGEISFEFIVPEDAKSGEHALNIRIYESSSIGDVLNEGFTSDVINVNPFLKSMEILVDSENIEPGNSLIYRVNTYDQAGDIINEDISVTVYEPEEIIHLKDLIKPEIDQKIDFEINNMPGYWKIEATAGEISKKKLVYLEEKQKILSSLIDGTLVVTNIGNVDYEGPLEIEIGSAIEVRQLEIKVGESKNFKLRAPDGNYQISVNDGEEKSVLGNTFLTGRVVKVVGVGEGVLDIVGNAWIWWLMVSLFLGVVVFVQVKRYKTDKLDAGNNEVDKKDFGDINKGTKEKALVISLKTEIEKETPYVSKTIQDALHIARNIGAKVYLDGDYKVVLVSPKLTKKEDNEKTVVNVARKIDEIFIDHNKRYKDKIKYGIGVNEGEIISENTDGKFKFTSLGNTVTAAKKISNEGKMKVLLSDAVRKSVSDTIKTQKSKDGNYWEISRIIDRETHGNFLKRFIKHEKKE